MPPLNWFNDPFGLRRNALAISDAMRAERERTIALDRPFNKVIRSIRKAILSPRSHIKRQNVLVTSDEWGIIKKYEIRHNTPTINSAIENMRICGYPVEVCA